MDHENHETSENHETANANLYQAIPYLAGDITSDRVGNFHSLSDDIVNTLLIDRAGTLWVGTNAGLNRFDPERARFTHFFDNMPIHDIVEDAAGMLWVGTVAGLAQFDPVNRRTTWYRHDADTPGSLSRDDVWQVLIDTSGTLWVGTIDGGLNHLDAETGHFIAHRYDPERANSMSNNAITALYQDREGLLWGDADQFSSVQRASYGG
ncbi:MAG: two-component regulator propeller domain-containing protein [Chloroflexaceae bacterium]